MLCTKFQVFRSKAVTGRFWTDGHTYRGPKQGKPGRNRNSLQGLVLVSGHYWFVKQWCLVNITSLYRVQVSEKYRFLPQRFNIETYGHTYRGPKQGKPGRNRNSSQGSVLVSGHYWFVKKCWLVNITGLYRVQISENYRFLPQRFKIISFGMVCKNFKNEREFDIEIFVIVRCK